MRQLLATLLATAGLASALPAQAVPLQRASQAEPRTMQKLAEKPPEPKPADLKPAEPKSAEPKSAEPKPDAAKPNAELPADTFTYHADGRRDPFVNLLGTGPEPRPLARKGDGLGALLLAEISVRGVMQSRDALLAMISGPDNKTYVVHPGDKLLDCTIKTITQDGLVVTQRVTDPLSGVKQREIHKMLRSLEDAKE